LKVFCLYRREGDIVDVEMEMENPRGSRHLVQGRLCSPHSSVEVAMINVGTAELKNMLGRKPASRLAA
jgi:hypothetical protein